MTLRVELDSVVKRRNSSEWRDIPRASCEGLEEVGDHRVIVSLCRRLLDRFPSETMVEVWRGDLPCFRAVPLGSWASGKVGRGEQPEQLKRLSTSAPTPSMP